MFFVLTHKYLSTRLTEKLPIVKTSQKCKTIVSSNSLIKWNTKETFWKLSTCFQKIMWKVKIGLEKKTIQFRSRSLCIPDNEYLIELHTIYHTIYTTKDGNKTWRARPKLKWSVNPNFPKEPTFEITSSCYNLHLQSLF